MADPAIADRTSTNGTGSRLRSRVTTRQLYGITLGIIGMSLLPVSFALANRNGLVLFVLGSAGWLLISLAYNLVRDRSVIYNEWTDNERIRWFIGLFSVLVASLVAVAAVLISTASW